MDARSSGHDYMGVQFLLSAVCFLRPSPPGRASCALGDERAAMDGAMESSFSEAATILVVDDDRDNAVIVRDLLEAHGYTVFVAGNGDEGLAMFDETRPAIVLLDIMMPGRSGWEVCHSMKQHPTHGRVVRVIMLTALSDWSDKQAAIQTGADDYITKPVGFEDLLTCVKRNLAFVGPPV
jgi:CheY-like chemotaxis protein